MARTTDATAPLGGLTNGGFLGDMTQAPYRHASENEGDESPVRGHGERSRRTTRTALVPAAVTPTTRHRTGLGEPYAYTATVVRASWHVSTGSIRHLRKHRAPPTAQATPSSVPVPGSGETDSITGKSPSGASDDLPRLPRPGPGLWNIAAQHTTRVGRYIADEPSFAPD